MSDLPPETATPPLKDKTIQVTSENAPLLTVHYLAQIFGRLGYIIKLLEEKK